MKGRGSLRYPHGLEPSLLDLVERNEEEPTQIGQGVSLSRGMSKQQNLEVDHEDIEWVGTPPFCKSLLCNLLELR